MVQSGGWHKVVESTSKLRIDSNQFKMRPCIADRRLLLTTASGVKRIAAIYADNYPADSGNAVNYSTMYRDAGIPRALDPRCPNAVAASGTAPGLIASTGFEWLPASSAVAYQVNWFKRDENAIPGVGAPSGRVSIRNTNTTTAYATRLKIPIPAGVADTSYVLQVNRTTVVQADATGDIPDPGADMFLVGEYRVTAADLANQYILYEDVSFDGLLQTDLYTNETQEGPLAARFQPPICRDITTFGGCSFFANTTERQRMLVRILAVDPSRVGTYKGVRVGDMLVMGDLVMEGVQASSEESQTWYFGVDETTGIGSEVIRALKTTESIVYKYNLWSNAKNGRYYAYNMTTTNDIVGVIMLEEKSIGGSTGAYVGANRVDSPIQILPAPVFTSTPSNTLAQACAVVTNAGPTTVTVTAAANHNLTTNDLVFLAPFATSTASGTSSPKFVNTQVPSGVYKITVTGGTTFTFTSPSGAASAQTDARAATTGGYFHKIFDSTTSVWTEARSNNNRKINRLMWSPVFEPESAPISNSVDLGGSDKAILRVVPTQDSLFVFKEDGIWRLKGEGGDWEIIIIDASCILAAPESPGIVDGSVYFFSTNGIFSVNDGGTSKISGPVSGLVDNYFRSLALVQKFAIDYAGVGHSEDQSYWLVFGGTGLVVRYHVPTKSWSEQSWSDNTNAGGSADPCCVTMARASRYSTFDAQAYADRIVVGFRTAQDCIGIERRTSKANELCDFDIPVTVLSFTAATNTVTLSAMPTAAEVGDTFLWYPNARYGPGGYGSTADYRYRGTITAINGASMTISVSSADPLSSWPAVSGSRSGSILKRITSRISFMLAGQDLAAEHFSELSISAGSRGNFSSVSVGFLSDTSHSTSFDTTAGSQASATINGYAGTLLAAGSYSLTNRYPGTMPLLNTFRCGIPRQTSFASFLVVSLTNDAAFDQFDLAGYRLISTEGSRARRTNA